MTNPRVLWPDDRDPAFTVPIRIHDQCDVGFGPCRRGLRVSFGLSDAERLVADRRCAEPLHRARRGGRVHAWPALCPRGLRGGGPCCRNDAVSEPALWAEGGRDHRADLHLVLRIGAVHGVAVADVGIGADDYHGQYPGDHTRGHAATGDHRLRVAGGAAGPVERSDGDVLRRKSCAVHGDQYRAAERGVLHPAIGLLRGGIANRRGVSGDCDGGDAGRHGLSVDRPLPEPADDQRRHRRDHQLCGRLSQLLP